MTGFEISEKDLELFLGICLLSGIWKFPRERTYWQKGSVTGGCPAVANAMSRNRFEEIKSNLHLADNSAIDLTDRLFKVRGFFEMFNRKLQQFGIFDDHLSVDEEMVPYYGPHSLKQCMLQKPIRFGYKLFVLATSRGYPLAFFVYEGKVSDPVCDVKI